MTHDLVLVAVWFWAGWSSRATFETWRQIQRRKADPDTARRADLRKVTTKNTGKPSP